MNEPCIFDVPHSHLIKMTEFPRSDSLYHTPLKFADWKDGNCVQVALFIQCNKHSNRLAISNNRVFQTLLSNF